MSSGCLMHTCHANSSYKDQLCTDFFMSTLLSLASLKSTIVKSIKRRPTAMIASESHVSPMDADVDVLGCDVVLDCLHVSPRRMAS